MVRKLRDKRHGDLGILLLAVAVPLLASCQSVGAHAARGTPEVLLVCNGSTRPCPRIPHYRTVQSAVTAARPGTWVLIWPGVYHENNPGHHAGVWIDTPDVHIRGLNRNTVVIDGSHGPAASPCPSSPSRQDFAPRDGIVVWHASGVTIQNLTVCDYLGGPSGEHGSQIWWTGTAAGTADLDLGAYSGSYLTATSMYHPADVHSQHLAEFGIFAGGARGPGLISNSYVSNMANAAYYVGACQRSCDTVLTSDRGTNSASGFLGTNSGGRLVVKNSEFDSNRTGVLLVSLNTDDLPPFQDGRCPGSTGASCTVIEEDRVLDNNNADAPTFGISPAIGTGIEISGGQYDVVTRNVIAGNGSWGLVVNDEIDLLSTLPGSHCQGGTANVAGQGTCLFIAAGNRISGNTFSRDGLFGNPTNGDLATSGLPGSPLFTPRNCFFGNLAQGAPLTSSPPRIQASGVDGRPCGRPGTIANPSLLAQLRCADGYRCVGPRNGYPRPRVIDTARLPILPTMPRPCAGVPRSQICP